MKKGTVTVLEIIYGLLLKFGKIDDASINVLMQQLGKTTNVEIDQHSKYYFVTEDGFIILNQLAIESILKQINNKRLEDNQGIIVKKYLEKFSLSELVLRKIKAYGFVCLDKDYILDVFSVSQMIELKELINGGYLMDYWEEESLYDDYHAAMLTQKGEVKLFLIDHTKEINSFFRSLGIECDEELEKIKEDFLMTQNLSLNTKEILTIENFRCFCMDYDRHYLVGCKLSRKPKRV